MKYTLLVFLFSASMAFGQQFSEVSGTPFPEIGFSTVTLSDIDNDGDEDVLFCGARSNFSRVTFLYKNEGGDFVRQTNTPFVQVMSAYAAFSDFDGDGDNDLVVSGINGSSQGVTNVYRNNGGEFEEWATLQGLRECIMAVGDIDGDGDDDILLTGLSLQFETTSMLYINDGGQFTMSSDNPFDGYRDGDAEFVDVDNDGDLDLFISGYAESGKAADFYINENGAFAKVSDHDIEPLAIGDLQFNDVDGDGDMDLLTTGDGEFGEDEALLYLNDNGVFTEVSNAGFVGISSSALDFADVDGDGDDDVLLSGRANNFELVTRLYKNTEGSFEYYPDAVFPGFRLGDVGFSDTDGDGDQDVFIMGRNEGGSYLVRLYENESMSSVTSSLLDDHNSFILFPNPVLSKRVTLDVTLEQAGKGTMRVYNANGQLVLEKEEEFAQGHQQLILDVDGFNSGQYVLSIEMKNRVASQAFLVE